MNPKLIKCHRRDGIILSAPEPVTSVPGQFFASDKVQFTHYLRLFANLANKRNYIPQLGCLRNIITQLLNFYGLVKDQFAGVNDKQLEVKFSFQNLALHLIENQHNTYISPISLKISDLQRSKPVSF